VSDVIPFSEERGVIRDFDVVELNSTADFSVCATMMLESNPWNRLYFTREQCERDLAMPEMRVHGAVKAGEIIAFLTSVENGIGFEPMIEYLCVRENFRNMGVGSVLVSYFENELFPEADNLYLFVSDINPDAARLYARLGYAQVGAIPNFNLPMQTEFLYRKTRRPRQLRYRNRNAIYLSGG
jgi:predicted GNAT family acetyltransferase